MAKLTAADHVKLAEIMARWNQPRRISRFGGEAPRLLSQAVVDIATLVVILEQIDRNDRRIGFRFDA